MDEQELEQVLRAGLAGRAGEADVTAPVHDRARSAVARRRRTRWTVVGAAAAVVLVVGGVAVATRGDDDRAEEPPTVADSGTTDASTPAGWRTEYYGAVAVDVPPDWGYGGAPTSYDALTVCAPGSPPGYVGRPVTLTDVCTYLRSGWQPTAPYVWLGGNVDPGTYEWDNGYVQEAVEVEGVTVTVGSDDAGLREQVLASARPGDSRCAASYPGVPGPGAGVLHGSDGGRHYAWACAYRKPSDAGPFVLTYAGRLRQRDAETALAAEATAPAQDVDCDYDPFEFVVLETGVPGDSYARTVYETGCAGGTVHLGDGSVRKMVDAGVRPWAGPGIRSTLSYFIGPIG